MVEEHLIRLLKIWDTENPTVQLIFNYHRDLQLYSQNLELDVTRYVFSVNSNEHIQERLEKIRCCMLNLHRLYNISKENHEKYLSIYRELNFADPQLNDFSTFVNFEYKHNLPSIPLWFLDNTLSTGSLEEANDLLSNILTLHDAYRQDELKTYEENLEMFKIMLYPIIEENFRFNHSMSMLLYHYYNRLYFTYNKVEKYVSNIMVVHDVDDDTLEEGEVVDSSSEHEELLPPTTMFTYAKIEVIN